MQGPYLTDMRGKRGDLGPWLILKLGVKLLWPADFLTRNRHCPPQRVAVVCLHCFGSVIIA